jgi:hypothetical protein
MENTHVAVGGELEFGADDGAEQNASQHLV